MAFALANSGPTEDLQKMVTNIIMNVGNISYILRKKKEDTYTLRQCGHLANAFCNILN